MKKILPVFVLAGLIACGDGRQPVPINDEKESASTVKPVSTPTTGGYGSNTPASAQEGAPAQVPAQGVEKPAALVELEKSYEASPNEATRKKLAQATYEFGNKVMLDESLAPRVKYPQALRLFKRTLELEPGHAQAAAEKKQIEDIYASMGRPVPE